MKKIIVPIWFALTLVACNDSQKPTANKNKPDSQKEQNVSHKHHHHQHSTTTNANPKATTVNGTLVRVIAEPLYPPFIMPGDNGSLNGFEVELLQEIGKRQNLTFTFSPHPWDCLVDTLLDGNADLIAGRTFIRDDLKTQMDFTHSYTESDTKFLVKKSSGINKLNDLTDKKVAYQTHTVAENIAKEQFPRTALLARNTLFLGIKDLLSGTADAVIGDAAALTYYANQYKDSGLEIINNPAVSKEFYDFGMIKGNKPLQEKLNRGLAELKTDGTYDRLHKKWFKY